MAPRRRDIEYEAKDPLFLQRLRQNSEMRKAPAKTFSNNGPSSNSPEDEPVYLLSDHKTEWARDDKTHLLPSEEATTKVTPGRVAEDKAGTGPCKSPSATEELCNDGTQAKIGPRKRSLGPGAKVAKKPQVRLNTSAASKPRKAATRKGANLSFIDADDLLP